MLYCHSQSHVLAHEQSADICEMRKCNFTVVIEIVSVEEYVLKRKSAAMQQVGCDQATGRDSISLLQVQPNVQVGS